MKRLVLSLTLALSLISFSSFANDDVTPAALESFKSSFKNATDVNWTSSATGYKAAFALNGQYISAYYDGDGKLVALTRNLSPLELPLILQTNLKKDYSNFWISNLFELSDESGTTYYMTVENADTRLVLKSTSEFNWNTFQKSRKS
jgi:hypothetical protein